MSPRFNKDFWGCCLLPIHRDSSLNMRIEQLILRNFRCYADTQFRFDRQFNLIVGQNGAGKTSLLQGLAVAAGSWFLGIRGYDSRNIQDDQDVRRVTGMSGDTLQVSPQYPVTVEAAGTGLDDSPLEWGRSLEAKGGRTTQKLAKGIKEQASRAEGMVARQELVTLPLISSYGAGRLWVPSKDMRGESEAKERLENNRLDGYLFSLDPRINFSDLFRWLKEERYVALEIGRDRFGFAAVKRAMCACLEDCISVDYHVAERSLVVETHARGRQPFDLLSDGQKSMLALVADIAFKAALLNPHLGERVLEETPGVVFIDELDLHIHPSWQRRLVTDLKKVFPSLQFFATTHSPQIVGETPPEQIILLHRDGTWSRPRQTIGLSSNQVLEHIMGAEAVNRGMAHQFDAILELVEKGDFALARERITQLRGSENFNFPELTEAENYMSSVEESARESDA